MGSIRRAGRYQPRPPYDQPRTQGDLIFLSPIEEIIEEARNGRMFILVDDEDRENEGDLVIPAQMATPDAINFMAKNGRGLICLSLTKQRVKQLDLPLMPRDNRQRQSTAFTVSIEAAEGVTTGISAGDRARSIAVAIDPSKGKDDISANAITRSYSSTAMTTTNGLSYLVTATGAMRAASMSTPKWFLAPADENLRMRLLVLKP